ncbi:MAG: tetratricopeptide repeat protein [Mariprofundaceae bacterium]|nr:tetratricopeptide repeat protein [Mariprofundaceae bacterium]
MNKKTPENTPIEGTITSTDMVTLRRDMQQEKITAWFASNQQSLIASVIVLAVLLIGISLWQEQQRSQQESAALVYLKATNINDEAQRDALLDAVRQDYAGTGYAVLATVRQSNHPDVAIQIAALTTLMGHQKTPEIAAQARLDLAELHIGQGDIAAAAEVLKTRLSKHYEQVRYALLASISEDDGEKATWLQKAVDAESHDNDLLAELETELALIKAAQ